MYSLNLKQGLSPCTSNKLPGICLMLPVCEPKVLRCTLALAKCYNLLLITFPDIYPIYSSAYTSVECGNLLKKILIDDNDNVLDINSVVIKHFYL